MTEALKGYPGWETQAGMGDYPWVAACLEFTAVGDTALSAEAVLGWIDNFRQDHAKDLVLFVFERERLSQALYAGGSNPRLVVLIADQALQALKKQKTSGFKVKILHVGKNFDVPWDAAELPAKQSPSRVEAKAPVTKPGGAPESPDKAPGRATPIIGIIDDGIAFLNARFCKMQEGARKTRFLGVWLQSGLSFSTNFGDEAKLMAEPRGAGPFDSAGDRPLEGNGGPAAAAPEAPATLAAKPDEDAARTKVIAARLGPNPCILESADIDALLAGTETEAETYRWINGLLYPATGQPSTNTSAAHGTHVLDLAAGADPDEADCPPLLAVQLAPAMTHDTSGRRLESFLVLGLRWMATRALQEGRDLVVNISLGSLAGSGDSSNFIADQIRAEIEDFQRQGKGRRMSVVMAYGNSWRSNLVAKMTLEPGKPRSVDWRILPEDYSSSYLEVRLPTGASGVTLTLTSPDGATLGCTWREGVAVPDVLPNRTVGDPAILTLAQEAADGGQEGAVPVLLAVSPTARPALGETTTMPVAKAGAWKVTLALEDGFAPQTATFRVQRGDTPPGYRVLGRQSYLADPEAALDWDSETRDYTDPKGTVVTREQTANAYAGLKDATEKDGVSIFYIGAAERNSAKAEGHRPQRFTSEGRWAKGQGKKRGPGRFGLVDYTHHITSEGPTFSTLAEFGRFLPGLRGASVLSGARSLRLSGTSMAAGLATRLIAERMAGCGLSDSTESQEGKATAANSLLGVIEFPVPSAAKISGRVSPTRLGQSVETVLDPKDIHERQYDAIKT